MFELGTRRTRDTGYLQGVLLVREVRITLAGEITWFC